VIDDADKENDEFVLEPEEEKDSNGVKDTKEIEDKDDGGCVVFGAMLKGLVEIDSEEKDGDRVGSPNA